MDNKPLLKHQVVLIAMMKILKVDGMERLGLFYTRYSDV